MTGLTDAQTDTWLNNRVAKGFNTVLVEIINHYYTANAPNDANNNPPFSNLNDWTTTQTAYWAHVDHVIQKAYDLGILLLVIPAYFGYPTTEEGWDTEMTANGNTKLHTYGNFLGNRYKGFPNIIWMMGGDRDPDTTEMAQINAIRTGIEDYNTTQWMSLDTFPGTSALDAIGSETWLDINDTYTYQPSWGGNNGWVYENSRIDYQRSGPWPFFLKESYAEEIGHSLAWTTTTAQWIRRQSYWSLLMGSCGAIFMNDEWAFFDSALWSGAMDSDGSVHTSYVWKLFDSRPWQLLVPDISHEVLTAGYGTDGNDDFATVALTSDSSCLIAYLPTSRQVTIDMSKMSGAQSVCYWYNPSTSAVTTIGTYDNSGTRNFTPAAGDWVLVLDDTSKGRGQPGQ